jgi:hypothetical protein
MFAMFLKSEDGTFAYGPAFGAVIFIGSTFIFVWILYRALTRGNIPFCFPPGSALDSTLRWFDRGKNPAWFWFFFTAYSLAIPFCIWSAYALCTGLFHKAD